MKGHGAKILILMIVSVFILGLGTLPVSAADKVKYGGTLIFNHGKEAGIIGFPPLVRGWNNEYACIPMETLMESDPDEPSKIVPRLAASWELAPDKSHYIFKFQKGVKFHDGTPFNAQAVKWVIEKYKENNNLAVVNVSSVDVIDEHTAKINLSTWDNTQTNYLAGLYSSSPTAYEKNGQEWAGYNPIGTSPFKVTEFKRKVHLKLGKFKDYYEKEYPRLDKIKIVTIPDPMTASAALKRGEIDAWMNVMQVTAAEIAKEGKWTISSGYGPYYLINYNSVDSSSPWSSLKMRQALEYAIDKEAVARVTGRGFRDPVWTVLYGLDHKRAGTTPRKFNPEKARQLMKEAGYPNGLKIELYHYAGVENDAAAVFQGMLADVGIEAKITPLAGAAWHGKLFEPIRGSEILWGFLPGGMSNVIGAAKMNFTGTGQLFDKTVRPEGFVEAINMALGEENMGKAMDHMYRAEKIAYDNAILGPVLVTRFVAVSAPYVKDADFFYAAAPRPNLKRAWLDK